MTEDWHRVGAYSDLDVDEPIAATIEGREIGVHLVDGKIYAIDDKCPHAYVMLSKGFADGPELTCPKHLAVFHIPTGKCLIGPKRGEEPKLPDLTVHAVRIEGNDILVNVHSEVPGPVLNSSVEKIS
ncbi:MAG: Rieske 2Fe-2S domain-containing protein [Alphaproteobacteria bacterium]|nr:Rieske 2Fe-2S domain-containing protein [Alphaproteobacteria bacterium]